jgi:hypothetical protein
MFGTWGKNGDRPVVVSPIAGGCPLSSAPSCNGATAGASVDRCRLRSAYVRFRTTRGPGTDPLLPVVL